MIRSCGQPRVCGLLLVLVAASCARAGGELTDQVKETTDKILSIVQDPGLKDPNKAAERRNKIRKVIDGRFNWELMARGAMGNHWRGLTEAQRKEFAEVFSRVVEQAYMAKVENYSGEKILYKGERASGKYGAVDVVVTTLSGADVPVSYRLISEGGKWMVHDLAIEGVSLINNYRTQIGAVLDKSSYADLIKKMRATIAKNDGAQADPNAPPKRAEKAEQRR
jgi:phospholipid transport system substrate-binding protein